MTETMIVAPNAERVVEGLRDTGYEFKTAIADLVDNSIAAEASVVDISVKMDMAGNIRVSIADNGIGMDKETLIDAMRYGSRKRANPKSLGKFGLGLKTASTAFCRRLTVATRGSVAAPILSATWDLDHIRDKQAWELLIGEADQDAKTHLHKVAPTSSGTVIVWQKVDRLLKSYQEPGGAPAQKALKKSIAELSDHLGMVFQRFLNSSDERATNLRVILNGQQIEAWDPFCVDRSELVAGETVPVDIGDGRTAEFTIRAYVLPRKEEFPSEDEARTARLSNDRQGIYLYREERLIHEADWLGIFQKEPHGTLLRVEFSFNHDLDEAFRIDLKKSQIGLAEELWNWLADEFLPAPRRAANDRYRRGQKKKVAQAGKNSHAESNANIKSKEEDINVASVNILDEATGEVEVTNAQGKVRLRLKLSKPTAPNECYVKAVDELEDGVLWAPALIDQHKAVLINQGHPYYSKVYVPNLSSGVTIQGMDSLLWALCAAELGTVSHATKQHFNDLRFMVSRMLRQLVEDLPEPELPEAE